MVLAEGIDAILLLLEHPLVTVTPSAWGEWETSPTLRTPAIHTTDPSSELAAARKADAIAELEAQIAVTVDGEDQRALEAKLRLLKDDGKPIEPAVEEGIRLTTDGDLVGLPAADEKRKAARRFWALSHSLHTYQSTGNALTEHEMADAFAKGGPMWLYLYDRDGVMRMADTARRDLIADLEHDSPAEAQQVARDILKDLTAEGARDTTLGYIATGGEE